jgi:AraC-like DNA-binding protein
VRQVVSILLASGTGYPDIQLVADRVGTSVRTLQRRLRATGVTYADVVQQARCAAARQMLKEHRRRIGDVARLLGYSDPAHFTRAFQRWTGSTPRDFRRRG